MFWRTWASCWPSRFYRDLPRRMRPRVPVFWPPIRNFCPWTCRSPAFTPNSSNAYRKLEYSGTHRNIFVAAPPPPENSAVQLAPKPAQPFVGPRLPPPPPPLQVPAEFFGYATRSVSGKRVAFFTSGDDVLVVPEGDTFLGRFRLIHIGNDSADVEEIATGRHASVQLVQPPPEQGATSG